MKEKFLTVRKENNIATIKNGLVEEEVDLDSWTYSLYDICSDLEVDQDIRVIVLEGSVIKALEFSERLAMKKMRLDHKKPKKMRNISEIIAAIDRPVIASIIGDAIGQGLELALACDIRIAQKKSHFGFPYIKDGIFPWDGGTQRLPRLIGRAAAMEMILSGKLINAQEAHRLNLINKVVPAIELSPETNKIALEIASKATIALKYAKEAVNKGMDLTMEQGIRLESDLYFLLHTTQDREEGIRSFQKKKKAKFKGK
jgi:enoyl-CoA hydratase